MFAPLSQMVDDLGVVAAYFLQSVSQHCKADRFEHPCWQDAVLVGSMGESKDGRSLPCRVQRDRPEGVAKQVPQESKLGEMLGMFRCAGQELNRVASGVGGIPRIIAATAGSDHG